MKKTYETPEITLTLLDSADILTVSGTESPILPEDNGGWVW